MMPLQTSTVMPTSAPTSSVAPPPQTPQSQYLASVLKSLQAQQQTSPSGMGANLLGQALLDYAQHNAATQAGQYGASGSNAQKNAASDQMAAGLASIGQPLNPTPALPTTAPVGGLVGLGQKALSLFGGAGG